MGRNAPSTSKVSLLPLAILTAGLTVAVGAAAEEPPYPPAARLEEFLGGVGSYAAARWYDPGTRTISSTDAFSSTNATTAFSNLAAFPSLCPSGVGPGSPYTTAPATVGTDV